MKPLQIPVVSLSVCVMLHVFGCFIYFVFFLCLFLVVLLVFTCIVYVFHSCLCC